MSTYWQHLRRILVDFDRQALTSLGLRLVVTILFFSPWAFRYERSVFRMEDVDPYVIDEARSRGIHLMDPTIWPSAFGIAMKLMAVALVLGFVWWLISRARRFLTIRFGTGVLPLVLVIACCIALYLGIVFTIPLFQKEMVRSLLSPTVPVWNGWVHHPLLSSMALSIRIALFLVVCPWILEMVLYGLESRMQLAEARDGALRARLAPHFLFNTLNTLHAQIEEDAQAAQATTEHLARLFRQVLDATEKPTVPLQQELAFVEDYLGIEQARLGDRLKVDIDVSEDATEAKIPVLGLHTLVENAIRHGVEPQREGGTIHISARLEGKRVQVSVEDPGDGSSGKPGAGRALANLRARLARPKDLQMARTKQGFCVAFSFPQF